MNWWGLFAFSVFMSHVQANERVSLDDLGGMYIDKTEVTIAQFAKFTKATGLVTKAELEGGGIEFVAGWQRRAGWTWQRPEGVVPSNPELPAVHLTHSEAKNYCSWVNGRLPTAAEWPSRSLATRGTRYANPVGG